MSEPMSTGEIEDVLSSIRRLVSEDLRPMSAHPTSPKAAAAVPSGKLLLTPALRVVSNTSDAADPPEDHIAATVVSEEDWLPEAAATTDDEIWLEADAQNLDGWAPEADLTRVVSEIGAAVAQSAGEWEPEVGDAPVASATWGAAEWVEEAELVDAAPDTALDEISAKALADAAEEEAVAEIMDTAEAEALLAGDDVPFAEPDGGYFDEAVLRDLVRDLIREELSGSLGERITRNVRKLVRVEINRALTTRDFE